MLVMKSFLLQMTMKFLTDTIIEFLLITYLDENSNKEYYVADELFSQPMITNKIKRICRYY